MHPWMLLLVGTLQATPVIPLDTGACGAAAFPGACLEAARDTAARRLDSLVARILNALPDAHRAAFDSASDAWDQYMNAECQLMDRAAGLGGEFGPRAVTRCFARLTDDRRRSLADGYRELLLHPAATQSCLPFEPDTISLTGSLERRTYPGLPNYESIARGDEPETGWYLRLTKPLCVTGNISQFNAAMAGILLVQLDASRGELRQFPRLRGRRVTVRGSLFEPGTVHWHARVVLSTVDFMKEVKSVRP